ncbi:MAG: UPF0753 protein [Vicingaceae bacterium]|nr:MAG: UPF0753 protein [Vicingaceae bacterium]
MIINTLDKVCKTIAPTWPLENSVAVNPFWGMIDLSYHECALRVFRNGNIKMYMPAKYYLNLMQNGYIKDKYLQKSLNKCQSQWKVNLVKEKLQHLNEKSIPSQKLMTIAEMIDQKTGNDFQQTVVNETSARLSVYFDKFGDYFPKSGEELFYQWHQDATIDLMPEIAGMKNFRSFIKQIPDDYQKAFVFCSEKLNLNEEELEQYLHAVLLNLIGWSSYLAGIDWDNRLSGKQSDYLKSLTCILLCWETYFHQHFPEYVEEWEKDLRVKINQALPGEIKEYFELLKICHYAMEFRLQDDLVLKFNSRPAGNQKKEPGIQMAFCIDVRSEVVRRHIESLIPEVETIGIAGFFGFPIQFYPVNNTSGKKQCPVLINPQGKIFEKPVKEDPKKFLINHKIDDAIRHFKFKYKIGVVSGFSYVSPLGLYYLPKLIGDSLKLTRPIENPKELDLGNLIQGKTMPDLSPIPFEIQVQMGLFALKALGIKDKMGKLVVLTGHGSTSVNNPHATSLDCGACGGNSGEVNALVGSMILNDPNIREEIRKHGIVVPEDTYFMAAIHDTTTDQITLLRTDLVPESHVALVTQLQKKLHEVTRMVREEKVKRFSHEPFTTPTTIVQRSKDWSQVRPEWGLAGCHSFVIAPREHTKGIDLDGKVFLHNYDFKKDKDFSILENLMTAPMVVTHWINMQYNASTTDPAKLGAGNKTLHNPVSGLGVLEGSTGDLRIGLPLQSIHDGTEWQHMPVRLNVFIEAPENNIIEIIEKHKILQSLVKNEWIFIFSLDEQGIVKSKLKYQTGFVVENPV